MADIYLENLQIGIRENKDKLTLKELNELYGEDYIPPYFVINGGGRIYPFSEFWKIKLMQLDAFVGDKNQKIKDKSKDKISYEGSRTWRNKDRKKDKAIMRSILGEHSIL